MPRDEYDLQELIRLHEAGLTQAQIGRHFNLGQRSVGEILARNGIATRRRGPRRRYALNEAYFAAITTEERAYWLGFLAADGFIIRSGAGLDHGLGVRLAVCDIAHLRDLASALESDSPVRVAADGAAEVRFHSTRLAKDLARHGVSHGKTETCEPWEAPEHLAAAYWRGAMDGDGHVATNGDYTAFAGTHAMCQGLAAFARGICGTKAQPRPTPGGVAWTIQVNGRRQVRAFLAELYGRDDVALARKKERALAILARPQPQPPVCSVDDCCRRVVARKLCGKHYQRWAKHGDPRTDMRRRDEFGRFC